MKNAYQGPKHDRYDIDPLELFKADRATSQRGLSIAGVYHSHPDYPATLSTFDLDHSFPWYSYVVVSVPKGKAGRHRSWIPDEDRRSASEDKHRGSEVSRMSVKVIIPTALRQHTNNEDELQLNSRDVRGALQELVSSFPNLKRYLYSENGRLRNFINIYLNEEDIRYISGENTQLKDGDTLMIVPSVAGGLVEKVNRDVTFSGSELARYSRHLIMPEVGPRGSKGTQGGQRPDNRRGRTRDSLVHVPRSGRGRQDRHRRLRCDRKEQPSPAGSLLRAGRREEQGGRRQERGFSR